MSFPGVVKTVRIRVLNKAVTPAVLVDPGTLTVRYGPVNTAGEVKTWNTDDEVVRDGVGLFHIDVTSDAAGEWAAHVETTGLGGGSGEKKWTIDKSALVLTP